MEAKGNVYLELIRKDLELFLRRAVTTWSNGCDTIERFELSLQRRKTEIVRRGIIDRKGISLHLGTC